MFNRRIFNTHLVFLWVPTVLHFSSTCSFIRTMQTSYRGFWRKTLFFRYIDHVFSLKKVWGLCGAHLSHWALKLRIQSYLDLHPHIDSEGCLRMKLCYKREDCTFLFWTFYCLLHSWTYHRIFNKNNEIDSTSLYSGAELPTCPEHSMSSPGFSRVLVI